MHLQECKKMRNLTPFRSKWYVADNFVAEFIQNYKENQVFP